MINLRKCAWSVAALSSLSVADGVALAGNDSGVLVTIAANLNQPVGVMGVPGDDSRLFVIGKTGVISVLTVTPAGSGQTYTLLPTPALDITSLVYPFDNRGLLGLAFAPDYQTSGFVYLFTNTLSTGLDTGMIVRYKRDANDPNKFDPASRTVIFNAPVGPYHHGGCLRFGPDGYLYFSKGDEGNIGILQCRNPGTYYGKVLRFDVSHDDFPLDPMRNYAIPADNPFAHTSGGMPEVWAMGLRSPWQFSFDRATGDMWIGDVGENYWEELTCILAAPASMPDLGWPSYEGSVAGPFGTMGVDPSRVTFPAYAYPHELQAGYTQEETGCSVNGGFVYRGSLIPSWRGRYFWSDFCSGRIFSGVRGPTGAMVDVADMTQGVMTPVGGVTPHLLSNLVAFGEDNSGELFTCELGGRVRKFVPRYVAADIGMAGGFAGSDGALDNNDFIVFIDWFFSADARCDLGKAGGMPGSDGVFDNNDLVVFIDMFFSETP